MRDAQIGEFMADDELNGESKEFDLDLRNEGALISLDPSNKGQVKVGVFGDTRGPCGTPNPPIPPTHIYVEVGEKIVLKQGF